MSHFTICVLLPDDFRPDDLRRPEIEGPDEEDYEDDLEPILDGLLAPFDENKEVDPYPHECFCKGRLAKSWIRRLGETTILPRLQTAFRVKYAKQFEGDWKNANPMQNSDYMDALVAEIDTPLQKWFKDELSKAPDRDDPDPSCEQCEGSGFYESTYNPKSKWDWWEIGGRWKDVYPEPFYPVKKFLDDPTQVFGYLIDGEWLERAEMGWFAITSNPADCDVYEKQVLDALQRHADGYCVVIDCHI